MENCRDDIILQPGVIIKEQLFNKGMKQKEFALRMGITEKHISQLIHGKVQLTVDIARCLEMVLGLSMQFWCNLKADYRDKVARTYEENTMDEEIEIAKKMPYQEMVKNGWIRDEKMVGKSNQSAKIFWSSTVKVFRGTVVCEDFRSNIFRSKKTILSIWYGYKGQNRV